MTIIGLVLALYSNPTFVVRTLKYWVNFDIITSKYLNEQEIYTSSDSR